MLEQSTQTRKQVFSAFALLFSIIALCVAVIPNLVSGLPSFLGDYTYLGGWTTISGWRDLLDDFSVERLFSTDHVRGLGATVAAVGLLFTIATAVLAIVGLITKRKLGRSVFAFIAFAATLGILTMHIYLGGADALGYILSNISVGYFIHKGAAFLAIVFSI